MGKDLLATLLAATTIDSDGTVAGTALTNVDNVSTALFLLTVAGKTMDASTTLDIWIQYSPDQGTTWDDLAAFAQITNAAIPNGKYVMVLNPLGSGAGVAARAVTDGTLAAGTIRDIPWGDRIRVKYKSANFAGSDEVTITVQAYLN